MKLAVSNIAWSAPFEAGALNILKSHGVVGIEVAPTRVWPEWNSASAASGVSVGEQYLAEGFTVPALQAILFGRPECALFRTGQERDALINHLRLCADIASVAGARSLVFGAPKNRELNGLSPENAFGIARECFTAVAPHYERRGVCLCLEANPHHYGCQFMTNSAEAARLVRAVNSPGVRLHLDTACMYLAQEDIDESVRNGLDVLQHFHVSEPFLGPFASPLIDHSRVSDTLLDVGYDGWVSLEMRETEPTLATLGQAVGFVARIYGGG